MGHASIKFATVSAARVYLFRLDYLFHRTNLSSAFTRSLMVSSITDGLIAAVDQDEGTGTSTVITNFDAGAGDTFDLSVKLIAGTPDKVEIVLTNGTTGNNPDTSTMSIIGHFQSSTKT